MLCCKIETELGFYGNRNWPEGVLGSNSGHKSFITFISTVNLRNISSDGDQIYLRPLSSSIVQFMVPSKNIFFFSLFCLFQEVFDIDDLVVKWAQTLGWTLFQLLSEGEGWLEVGCRGNGEGGRAAEIQGEKEQGHHKSKALQHVHKFKVKRRQGTLSRAKELGALDITKG